MKRFLLWDYSRGVWQYDLMVGLILAFIFLTPREIFRDQPRGSAVTMLAGEGGAPVYWIEPHLLDALPEAQRDAAAAELIRKRDSRAKALLRLEPIFDDEKEIKGYMAYTKP